MAIEPKENHMHLTVNSNKDIKLKDCLPLTYDMIRMDDGENVSVKFIENTCEVVDFKFKQRYGNETDAKYEKLDNIVALSSQVIFSNTFNVNLRYPLKPSTKYYCYMKFNTLATVGGIGDYSENMYVGYTALNAVANRSTMTEKDGIYTFERHPNYVGGVDDIFPINAIYVSTNKKPALGHKYRLQITQTSGPACKFGIALIDGKGEELYYIVEADASSSNHELNFDIDGLGTEITTEKLAIRIHTANAANEKIVFQNIVIQENIGYYAEQPLRVQYWNDENGGYRELTNTEFREGSIVRFEFTTLNSEASTPGAIRLINRNYLSGTTDLDMLITNFDDRLPDMDIVFQNHVAINNQPKEFNLMETEMYKFEELEIRYPATTRYIRMNRDPETNPLAITKVNYIDSSKLLYAQNMFRSCWTLTEVNFIGTTDRIEDMTSMFAMCGELKTFPTSLTTSGCYRFDRMFDYCVKLESLPEDFDTHNALSMHAMFRGCRELLKLPDNLDTSNVTDMREFVAYCQKLDTIPNLDTSSCTNMKRAFIGCSNMTTIPTIDTSHIESMEQICKDCELLGSIGEWETGRIKNFREAFSGCKSLSITPNLDTHSAITMEAMFKDCAALLNFPDYNFDNCRNIRNMFNGCTNLVGNYLWNYTYLELKRDPYVVKVVQEQKLPEGAELVDAKIPQRDENGEIMVTDDGQVMFEYEKDENGNIVTDSEGNPVYKYERNDDGTIKKTNIVYNVVFEARYAESLHEYDTRDYDPSNTNGPSGPISGCLDPNDWWDRWDETPVYENGEPIEETIRTPHFLYYEGCFEGCDSIANVVCIPDKWNVVYDESTTGLVYVYECVYITTGITRATSIVHKYFEVKTLEQMKQLGLNIQKLFKLPNFSTMVTCRILYTYRLPYKDMDTEEGDIVEVAN